jgi:CubicO group peptidase (beta-lactamase class C family)
MYISSIKIIQNMFKSNFVALNTLAFLIAYLSAVNGSAQIEEKKLDNLIEATLKTFDVPGISVGILKDGKIVYAKGRGVRSLVNKKD